uniref:Phosphatidylserine decarboxylase proenzyme, mitochondrial n=1 Tax=Romanomermis culicivorax TaxID=13658 RepID=A0A915J6L2_ROMCU
MWLTVTLIFGYGLILDSSGGSWSIRIIRNFGRKAKSVTKKVVPVSVAAGAGVVSYVCYKKWELRKEKRDMELGILKDPVPFGPWTLRFYVSLVPRKMQSRFFGYVNNLPLPLFLREPLLGLFCRVYNCDLSEAAEPDLKSYSNLSELFRRTLKPEVRPIAIQPLVSPADGRIDQFGEVLDDQIKQVKGITYDVSAFVGRDLAEKYIPNQGITKRFYCVIYLAPGDYHGFHSPADWTVDFRRHFSGHLLGVSEKVTKRVANLFCINERVLLGGRWRHGFFTMTAVGATNVGNISLNFENALTTNIPGRRFSHVDDLTYSQAIEKQRGEKVGEFRLGSSIVLFFEAPQNFQFNVRSGQKVKYGQALGKC